MTHSDTQSLFKHALLLGLDTEEKIKKCAIDEFFGKIKAQMAHASEEQDIKSLLAFATNSKNDAVRLAAANTLFTLLEMSDFVLKTETISALSRALITHEWPQNTWTDAERQMSCVKLLNFTNSPQARNVDPQIMVLALQRVQTVCTKDTRFCEHAKRQEERSQNDVEGQNEHQAMKASIQKLKNKYDPRLNDVVQGSFELGRGSKRTDPRTQPAKSYADKV